MTKEPIEEARPDELTAEEAVKLVLKRPGMYGLTRTDEPTPGQEVAAKAMWDLRKLSNDPEWDDLEYGVRNEYRKDARAALAAAQGAAPSGDIRVLAEAEVRKSAAEGNPISEPGVTKDIAFVRGAVFGAAQGAAPQAESEARSIQNPDNLEIMNGWLVERGVHEAEYPAGAAYGPMPGSDAEPLLNLADVPGYPVQSAEAVERVNRLHRTVLRGDELTAWCAHCEVESPCLTMQALAPVLPSSTVDEGKIAEVVRGLRFNDAGCWAGGIDCTESVSDHADVIARAVVEAIGGESRGRSN